MKNQVYGDSVEDRLLISRVNDTFKAALKHYSPRFIGFCDRHEYEVANRVATTLSNDCSFLFWGGYVDAERVMLGVYPPFEEMDTTSFTIVCIEISWKFGSLSHRDFLGALLSLGLRREKIGDIIIAECRCIAIVDASISSFIIQNLEKVGGSGVNCSICDGVDIKKQDNFKDISDTIASQRLDCVVAALINASRGEVEKMIISGLVSYDFETVPNGVAKVYEGSTVSIRGHGRFIIDKMGPITKKRRLKFSARQFI